ncbi:integrator complex subunit 11 [Dendrobium catenatum]|uniref:Integrator complex subunit 11 n=1 Tax=Dendrobium catenatum TaxID=906689 RepID=A0A2I0V6K4_9ASPA|nr:integrator complex subunit 11 [Dendrobium catenatum]
MNGDSVAGPDGFTTKFFIKTWDIVKIDVVEAVHDFFRGNRYPKFFSSTNIVLIPKKDNTTFWNDFRPISLCTFFNKLLAKIIASRLALILLRIIFSNQTGFEMVHDINAKGTGGNILFKLDITRAYDNLNWEYLYKILSLFGINQYFIILIKNSIENYFFFVIINGKKLWFF